MTDREQIDKLTLELLAATATLEEVRELLRDALRLFGKALFRIEDFKARLAAVEAERDAARAGEARAVKFASTVKSTIEESLEYCKQDSEVSIEWLKDLMNQADGIGYAHELGNALDWLDQQRREAAVEALEKLATDLRQDQWESALHDVDSLRGILRTSAAAIGAGEVENG